MILTDAGPLLAIIVRRDPDHERRVDALGTLARSLITTWPSFTEAMYLAGRSGGWDGHAALWRLVERGTLEIADISADAATRMRALMEQ